MSAPKGFHDMSDDYPQRFGRVPPGYSPPRKFEPSAQSLTWGILGLVIGQVIYLIGRQSALEAALGSSYYGSGSAGMVAIVIGALVSLAGLVALLIGVYRLGVNVDVTAKAAFDAARAGTIPAPSGEAP